MTPQLYVKLSSQTARQTPEAEALETQAAALQPGIDSAQAWADSCQASHDSATAALTAAQARPEGAAEDWQAPDTTAQQDAVSAASATLESAKTDLAAAKAPQDTATAHAAQIRAAIAQCQAAIDAGGLVMTEADIAAQKLAAARRVAIVQIDADVDATYAAAVGNRASEYALAEQHAQAYKDAGYTGTVPSSVAAWASVKGWTAQQAADDIIATADQWRGAQALIRAQRLAHKEAVRAAAESSIPAVMVAWRGFVAQMRASLGV